MEHGRTSEAHSLGRCSAAPAPTANKGRRGPAPKSGTAQPFRRFLLIMYGGSNASLDCCSHCHSRSDGRRVLRIRTGPPAPPLLSPAPNLGCQARTGGLVLPRPGETTGNANLSDELSRSKGVICPPAGVDPGISAPPVGGGVTPVIPPPGTPGGDP